MSRTLEPLGTVHEELDINFPYFGTLIRVNPELSGLSLLDVLAGIAAFDDDTETVAVVAAVEELRAATVHADDLDVFRKISRANRQDLDDLIDLAKALIEAVAEVPTEQPSGSSSGLTSTEPSSVVVSSSPVVQRLEAQGRPDLALVVVQAQEFRSA
jgi:hypothetical protein